MKRNKEYKVKMVGRSDGTTEVEYVMERVQLNQHKARWLPANKRDFTKALNKSGVTCK
jgi:hypothetical protein